MKQIKVLFSLVIALFLVTCNQPETQSKNFKVDYKKFELGNGLDVIFHTDRSDPVVAVALTVHVGSAREIENRTGFAHLFEHLLFNESENLGKGGLDNLSARVGGSGANGSTSNDRTNYFQTVPSDALEKMLWAEADKLGWFINTVTDPVLAKEKSVVQNEKRQVVDNQPYGHTEYVIDKNLFPKGHPYSWQVIGSLEDLQNATLQDVKDYYNRWYVPNNATLVVSGDFDTGKAEEWIHKYFDEIPPGLPIEPLPKQSGEVGSIIKLYHEDNFARLPELTLAWPSVEQFNPDMYPLDILVQYLSRGKSAPLYQVLVEDKKLAPGVRMSDQSMELAGKLELTVRAYNNTDLNEVLDAVQECFERFEKEGIPEKDLERIKAGQETGFYSGLSSVLGKGFQLAQYNIFTGDPGYVNQDIQKILSVTPADVMRVYEKYIKNKPYVATSFVPRGQINLALDDSKKAEVEEEVIVLGEEAVFDATAESQFERTPSTFDRTIEPPYGESPEIKVPDVWETELPDGMKIYGIENHEVPLVQFEMLIDGGFLLEDLNKTGVTNLVAEMMMRGTENKSARELEEAIQQIGASLRISASKEFISISGNSLAKNYQELINILKEVLTKPRWDEDELALVKQNITNRIRQQLASPNSMAQNNFDLILYEKNDIRSKNILGNEESVNAITMDDLKQYFVENLSPSVAKFHIVGDISRQDVLNSLKGIEQDWEVKDVTIPTPQVPETIEKSTVYFYDIPDAKQSVLMIGCPSLSAVDDDYYPASVMNYRLGGGGFASQFMQVLRQEKGYTYGIRSGFSGNRNDGIFSLSASVKTTITLEALQLVKEIMEEFPASYSENDMEITRNYMIKSSARAFETAGAKLNMLENVSNYGWDYDYVKKRQEIVEDFTVPQIKSLAEKYANPGKMIWLVVGDASSQFERLQQLGYGVPVRLN
ncbi:MAG: insulinase family protein [Prolixibacteraceae bacterium]|nr:insulinase family protein [Prolixibacteraceae bacterium]